MYIYVYLYVYVYVCVYVYIFNVLAFLKEKDQISQSYWVFIANFNTN